MKRALKIHLVKPPHLKYKRDPRELNRFIQLYVQSAFLSSHKTLKIIIIIKGISAYCSKWEKTRQKSKMEKETHTSQFLHLNPCSVNIWMYCLFLLFSIHLYWVCISLNGIILSFLNSDFVLEILKKLKIALSLPYDYKSNTCLL